MACAHVPRESRLSGAGGHSSHVAPRSCTEGETASAIAVYLHSARTDHNQRGTSRARDKLSCFATSRETATAVAPVRMPRECRLSGAGGHSSHVAPRSCAETKGPSAGAVPFHGALADHSQRSTARARGMLACFATSRDTPGAVALARRSREIRLCVGGHSSRVGPRSCTGKERPPAGAVPLYSMQADHNQRSKTRTRQARVFRHLPRDSQRSGARARATRKPAVRCLRPQLARRTTVLHRG